ncbi:hypothetical protein RJ639_038038 [Escallonia herrerae]|uniref:Uncharacterized protein n=1 Tax=Escallonia herrerae TaxID=1293975 RepID=A0AA89BF89_9ASTE|nr:hypothetical protein RJ639_038038 [Escallonia herrerae]
MRRCVCAKCSIKAPHCASQPTARARACDRSLLDAHAYTLTFHISIKTWLLIIAARNLSLEGLQANAQRLKSYKAKLVVFPRRGGRVQILGQDRPIVRKKPTREFVKISDDMESFKSCDKLRIERMNQHYIGARMKRAAEAEKEGKK